MSISRTRTAPIAALVALGLIAPGLGACSGEPEPVAATPTPIAAYGAPALSRIAFCDLIPAEAVTAALGEPATSDRVWDNGDQIAVEDTDPDGDVTHELGCEWSHETTTARAWVFARPVDTAPATEVVKQAGRRKGCTVAAPPAFGEPSLLQTCSIRGGQDRIRHAGLFGDTWLTCEIAGPRGEDLLDRAGAWCVAVADSLEATR